jgi:hypothetical protein
MPRIEMPLIGGQGGDYELVARVYDVLNEYTEVVCPIYVREFVLTILFYYVQLRLSGEALVQFANLNLKLRYFPFRSGPWPLLRPGRP